MAFPSTFLDVQNDVILRARLLSSNDLPHVKDWINKTYFDVCVQTSAIVTSFTATLISGTSRYSLTTTAVGVNALNSATINVVDTSFFPAAGTLVLGGVSTAYTGKTATTFTGCGNHAATTGGELIRSLLARIKQMAVTPSGGSTVNGPLKLTTLDEIMQRRQSGGDTTTGGDFPQSYLYTLVGVSDLELWPTPAAADTVNVYCSLYPAALTADTDTPILEEPYATNLLVYGAASQAGDFKGDPATADWENQYDTWMGKYIDHLSKKRGDQPGQFHVWGDGNWSGLSSIG